jgi:hypothetical protein
MSTDFKLLEESITFDGMIKEFNAIEDRMISNGLYMDTLTVSLKRLSGKTETLVLYVITCPNSEVEYLCKIDGEVWFGWLGEYDC